MSPFFTSARAASETNPIKAGSRSPIARTDRTANHDPVSSKFKTVALSVQALFGHGVMSDLSPSCIPKRTSANTSGFMGSRRSSCCRGPRREHAQKIGPEISVPVWTGKKLAGLVGDPIGHETHPFARSRIDKTQPVDEMVGKLQEIVAFASRPDTAPLQIQLCERCRPTLAYDGPTSPAAIARRCSATPGPWKIRRFRTCCANAVP